MTQRSRYVRHFIHRHPGPFDADTPQQCLVKAYRASGAHREMSLPEFTDELKAAGYEPKCVKNAQGGHPALYRLPFSGPNTIGVARRG